MTDNDGGYVAFESEFAVIEVSFGSAYEIMKDCDMSLGELKGNYIIARKEGGYGKRKLTLIKQKSKEGENLEVQNIVLKHANIGRVSYFEVVEDKHGNKFKPVKVRTQTYEEKEGKYLFYEKEFRLWKKLNNLSSWQKDHPWEAYCGSRPKNLVRKYKVDSDEYIVDNNYWTTSNRYSNSIYLASMRSDGLNKVYTYELNKWYTLEELHDLNSNA